MADWFRSSKMLYVSIVLQGDTSAFKRDYTDDVRTCDELEAIIHNFEKEMVQYGITPEPTDDSTFGDWLNNQRQSNALTGFDVHKPMLEFWKESLLEEHRGYQDLVRTREMHVRERVSAIEALEVTDRMAEMHDVEYRQTALFSDAGGAVRPTGPLEPLGTASAGMSLLDAGDEEHVAPGSVMRRRGGAGGGAGGGGGLQQQLPSEDLEEGFRFRHIAGTIRKEQMRRFERMVVRASKRQAYVRFAFPTRQLTDEAGRPVEKVVFAVFFHATSVARRVRAVCSAYGASLYSIPDFVARDQADEVVRDRVQQLRASIHEHSEVLRRQRSVVQDTLRRLARSVEHYKRGIIREKAICHNLNRFVSTPGDMLHGEGWVLADAKDRVDEALRVAHQVQGQASSSLPYLCDAVPEPPGRAPPTHFPLNKFTSVFQGVVDTYGVPRYLEANPALFTAATFPFLYGVMYGDVGHSLIVFLFSLFMVVFERRLQKADLGEIIEMAFHGRYMLLMMGFFGMYCGLIYNDLFSLGMDLFGSRYTYPSTGNGTTAEVAVRTGDTNDVYPVGMDPVWHTASNELLFFNSFKMKLSIVLGVTQMMFGLILKALNAIYFRSKVDLWLEAVPQIIFMMSLFGYMVFLIFLKWGIDWNSPSAPGAPPSLIDTMIGIVLTPGTVTDPMFSGQSSVHLILLGIAFICVPWMLVPKPYLLWKQSQQSTPARSEVWHHEQEGVPLNSTRHRASEDSEMEGMLHGGGAVGAGSDPLMAGGQPDEYHPHSNGGDDHGHENHGFGELFIHQMIETIEFVLGAVSNTASYLRLWALSLAHSQLAAVFWEKALKETIEMGNPIVVVVGFAVFAGVSFGVLCVMDVLECYLHALRLHWVEFQNKFFHADGELFVPFSFEAVLANTGSAPKAA